MRSSRVETAVCSLGGLCLTEWPTFDTHPWDRWKPAGSDVDLYRIGAMGFLFGGQNTIRGAVENSTIKAVIAEDPSPAVLADHSMSSDFSLLKCTTTPVYGRSIPLRVLPVG